MRGKDSDRATSVLSPQSSVLPPVLRVAVDVTPAMTQGAGIGRVARHLARALPLLDRETQFTYLYATEGRDGVIPAGFLPVPHPPEDALRLPATAPGYGPGENVTFRRLPLPAAWMTRLWHRARLPVPVERFTGPVDCYHALDYVAPRVRHARLLVTVHDLSFLAVPQYAERTASRDGSGPIRPASVPRRGWRWRISSAMPTSPTCSQSARWNHARITRRSCVPTRAYGQRDCRIRW
ncbi:MAG: hypothetical protein LC748_01695 [Thermomicrobia bacterium]|nr:hypothetical protein [Thermomicrobia bacterium]